MITRSMTAKMIKDKVNYTNCKEKPRTIDVSNLESDDDTKVELPKRIDYKHFWIKDTPVNRRKIDELYRRLEYAPRPLSNEYIKEIYNSEKKYFQFNGQIVKECLDNPDKNDAKHIFKTIFVSTFKELLIKTENAYGKQNRYDKALEILQLLVESYEYISHPSMKSSYEKLILTIAFKMIEFTHSEGIPEAFLVIALYFPDYVTEDIEPVMNFETDLYKGTDFDKIRDSKTYGNLVLKYGHHTGFLNPNVVSYKHSR